MVGPDCLPTLDGSCGLLPSLLQHPPAGSPQVEPLMDMGMDISGSVLFDSELLKMIKFD